MRRIFTLTLLASLAIVMTGCKSGWNAVEKGRYDEAMLQAIKRLRKNPDSKKAKNTLYKGYPVTRDFHLDNVKRMSQSNSPFKWESVINEYGSLRRIYNEIQRCPVCKVLAKSAQPYDAEIRDAKQKAAQARYDQGLRAMANRSREGAKQAFTHFIKADQYIAGFKDVRDKIEEARSIATLKIVVEPIPMHSRTYELSNEFFQNKIYEFMQSMQGREFVRFFSPLEAEQAGIRTPDHVILMQFDDFVVGQHYVKETVVQARDTVTKKKVLDDGQVRLEKEIVTAKVHTFRKSVTSTGLLDMKILDPVSNRVITQEKFPGTHIWHCEWGFFNGDERALDQRQRALTKRRELPPPPPQDLFVEFTIPIFDQITGKLRNFYNNY